MKTLRLGDKGTEVSTLQGLLSAKGFAVKVDGDFGRKTEAAVKSFQAAQSLLVDGIVGRGTWGALQANPALKEYFPTPDVLAHLPDGTPKVVAQMRVLGHKVYTEEGHLNLFGIRSPVLESNSFDDVLGACYIKDGQWVTRLWPGTTDPGAYWLQSPSMVRGTAILVPGQYAVHTIDKHNGAYEALCQRLGPLKVYRDKNKDTILDMDPSTTMEGSFGINIHRATSKGKSVRVDKWSAGCQVHARSDAFDEMMSLAHWQVSKTGNKVFTYTLMVQWW